MTVGLYPACMNRFNNGDLIRVVSQYDDTLPDEFVGRLGFVVQKMPYQGIGDSPTDPIWLVMHAPYFGMPAQKQIYWSEEIVTVAKEHECC